jgi:hypothetical protein
MKTKNEVLAILGALGLGDAVLAKFTRLVDSIPGDTVPDDILRDIKALLLEEEERTLDALGTELGVDINSGDDVLEQQKDMLKEASEIKQSFDLEIAELDADLTQLEQAASELEKVTDEVSADALVQSIKSSM